MINRSAEKYNDIITAIAALETKQCMYLGIMGMARTMKLIKHIGSHKQFENLLYFETFILGGMRKVLYNDLEIERDVNRGIEICNSLIPILEEYDYSDCINRQDEDIMGIAYSLVEEWYYFIGLLSLQMDNDKCKQMGRFLSTPCNLIDSYLHNKYDGIGKNREIQEQVNNDMALQHELETIDLDILFVSHNGNLENIKIAEERINKYMQYIFWK